MSTKIYNGMRFKSSVSLMDLNRIYKDIRGRLIRTAQEEYYKKSAEKAHFVRGGMEGRLYFFNFIWHSIAI